MGKRTAYLGQICFEEYFLLDNDKYSYHQNYYYL